MDLDRPHARRLGILAIGFLALLGGCGGPAPGPPTAVPPAGADAKPGVETKDYALKGEVLKVDKDGRELVIRHEEIPGFMTAMTMPFTPPRDADLDEFRVGDRVEGTLRVESEGGVTRDYDLVDLAVSRPALAPLVVDAQGRSVKLDGPTRRLRPGDAVPDFTMTGQDGQPHKLSDYRGHEVVLTFIYTRCPLPDFCPAMDRRFAELAESLSRSASRSEKVRLISLSFDPEHDTPEVLRKHARIRGATPPLWTFAVASHAELARIAPPLGLMYGPGENEIIHNLCTAVIDADGKLVRLEVGARNNRWTTADMLKTLFPSPSSD